jgi:hypothetical protein
MTEQLLMSSEKLPIYYKDTVVVVTRTMRENRQRQNRRLVVAFAVFTLFAAWLVWALFFVPSEE